MYNNNTRNTVVRSLLLTLSTFFALVPSVLAIPFGTAAACANAVPVDLVATHRGFEAGRSSSMATVNRSSFGKENRDG